MAEKQYSVSVLLKLIDQLNAPLDGVAKSFNRKIDDISKKLNTMGKQLTTFVTLPIIGLGVAAVKTAGDFETQTAAFETMLGSVEAARDMLSDFQKFSAKTPYLFSDLTEVGQTLLQFGMNANEVLPTIRLLGDVAQGNSQKLKQLGLVFGQIQSTGKLMGQDLLQLINAGFNPLTILAEKTGKSVSELKDEMSKGAISAEMVTEAFRIATSEGGRFFGSLERQSMTFNGLVSTMVDNIMQLAKSFGDIMLPALKNAVGFITGLVQWLNKLDESSKKIILIGAGIIAALGPLAIILSKLILLFKGLGAAIASNPFGLIAVAVAALIPLLIAFNEESKKSRRLFEEETQAMKDNTQRVHELIGEYEDLTENADDSELSQRKLKLITSELEQLLPGLTKEVEAYGDSLPVEKLKEMAEQQTKTYLATISYFRTLNQNSLDKAVDQLDRFNAAARRRDEEINSVSGSVSNETIRLFDQLREETGLDNLEDLAKRVKAAKENIQTLNQKEKEFLDLLDKLDSEKAADNLTKGFENLNGELDKTKESLKEIEDRLRDEKIRNLLAQKGTRFISRQEMEAINSEASREAQMIFSGSQVAKAEVQIRLIADPGTEGVINKINKDKGNVNIDFISESSLGLHLMGGIS